MEYQLTTGDFCVDETTYTAYGIRYGDILFDDVTLDREAMNALVALCNREILSCVHLGEVIEDFWRDDGTHKMDESDLTAEGVPPFAAAGRIGFPARSGRGRLCGRTRLSGL